MLYFFLIAFALSVILGLLYLFIPQKPKHSWDKGSEKWIWANDKAIREATPEEVLHQMSWGVGKIKP